VIFAVLLSQARPQFRAVLCVIDKRTAGASLGGVDSVGNVIAFAKERRAIEVNEY
jgi:hypothetical protein